jgi:hypothetical protein
VSYDAAEAVRSGANALRRAIDRLNRETRLAIVSEVRQIASHALAARPDAKQINAHVIQCFGGGVDEDERRDYQLENGVDLTILRLGFYGSELMQIVLRATEDGASRVLEEKPRRGWHRRDSSKRLFVGCVAQAYHGVVDVPTPAKNGVFVHLVNALTALHGEVPGVPRGPINHKLVAAQLREFHEQGSAWSAYPLDRVRRAFKG